MCALKTGKLTLDDLFDSSLEHDEGCLIDAPTSSQRDFLLASISSRIAAERGNFTGLLGQLDVVLVAPSVKMYCDGLGLTVGVDDLPDAPVVYLVSGIYVLMQSQ